MSNTQGDSHKLGWQGWITAVALTVALGAGGVFGVTTANNAAAEAAQQRLLASVKTSSVTMQAASADDAQVMADATQAEAVDHTNELAAAAEAARAAQEAAAAAAAKAASDAAAAQQAAQRQSARPQSGGAESSSSGPIRCPAGSQANSNDGTNDTSCFPSHCFTQIVDPNDPNSQDCLVAFKP